jgi:hypothetical protein
MRVERFSAKLKEAQAMRVERFSAKLKEAQAMRVERPPPLIPTHFVGWRDNLPSRACESRSLCSPLQMLIQYTLAHSYANLAKRPLNPHG